MRGEIPMNLKRKVFDQCILPTMTYGAETWAVTNKMDKKIAAAQYNMERNMLGITYKDRKTNKWIREQTKVQDIIRIIKLRKWRWAGHISRRTDNRWTSQITSWRPMDGYRNRGRQRVRWRDDIDSYWGTVHWQGAARNRTTWHQHAEAFIQQWIDNG